MIETRKSNINYGSPVGMIAMEPFPSLNHTLQITSREAYGLEESIITSMKRYLSYKIQCLNKQNQQNKQTMC